MLTWQGQTTSTNLSNSIHLTQYFYHVERNILWLTANLPRMPPVGVMSYLILFRLAQQTSNVSPSMKIWRAKVVDALKMYLVNITEGNILKDNKYLKNFMPFYLFEGTSTATFFRFLSPGKPQSRKPPSPMTMFVAQCLKDPSWQHMITNRQRTLQSVFPIQKTCKKRT